MMNFNYLLQKSGAAWAAPSPNGPAVFANILSSSRDSQYFTAPKKFIPSRWIEQKEQINPFSSLPFGFGSRMCYGRRIAELELYLLLVHVLRRFNLSTDQREIKVIQKTALRPNEPVKMQFINIWENCFGILDSTNYYCTIIIVYYCTIIIVYYCTIIIVYYCTIIIVYYCTIIIVYYCTIIIVYYCTIIIVYYCTIIIVQ